MYKNNIHVPNTMQRKNLMWHICVGYCLQTIAILCLTQHELLHPPLGWFHRQVLLNKYPALEFDHALIYTEVVFWTVHLLVYITTLLIIN